MQNVYNSNIYESDGCRKSQRTVTARGFIAAPRDAAETPRDTAQTSLRCPSGRRSVAGTEV